MIRRCYDTARTQGTAVPVVPVVETVREITGETSVTRDRSRYRLVQTPQTFQLTLLLRAYEQPCQPSFTDDASVVEALGHPITLVDGNRENIKITTPFDLTVAEALLQHNNRLDMVLSIFDQSRKDEFDEHILRLDERVYASDQDMEHILHRLTMAAADADIRHNMNVEDEYFSIIEKRDTELLLKDRKLAEQTVQIQEQTAQLQEKDSQLQESKAQLKARNDLLRSSIEMLLHAGISIDDIAEKLNIPLETVRQIMT